MATSNQTGDLRCTPVIVAAFRYPQPSVARRMSRRNPDIESGHLLLAAYSCRNGAGTCPGRKRRRSRPWSTRRSFCLGSWFGPLHGARPDCTLTLVAPSKTPRIALHHFASTRNIGRAPPGWSRSVSSRSRDTQQELGEFGRRGLSLAVAELLADARLDLACALLF